VDTARQDRIGALLASLERAVRAVPGVREVGFVARAPVVDGAGFNGDFSIVGDPPPAAGQAPLAEFQGSTPGYFRAMGLQLERGQMLAEVGSSNAQRVLINDAMARQYFGERNPLGMKLNAFVPEPLDIVGVVHGVRQNGLDDRVRPEIYFGWETLSAISEYTLLMRTEGEPGAVLDPVRRAIAQVDASVPVFETQTMDAAIAAATAQRRFLMQVMQFFALTALIIAVVGLYAVLSHAVAQRTSEFGVRLALGASSRSVLGTVAAEGWITLAAGIALGLTGAYAAGQLLASRLYGVGAADLAVFAALTAILVVAAQFSLLLPAWRASRVSPMQALRQE
jgi:putative ABC transport system permease protein